MSAIASPSNHPPGDADLQELYNQVLAGFAEESPTVETPPKSSEIISERTPDPRYAPYGADSTAARQPPRGPTSPRENTRPLPSPMYQQSPTQPKVRPLPRPPGASPATSPTLPGMPEPHPYYAEKPVKPVATPPRLKQNGDSSGRSYISPDVSPSSGVSAPPERPPFRGLPSDPRPVNRASPSLRPGSSQGTPSPTLPGHTRQANSMQYPMPLPEPASESRDLTYGQPWSPPSSGRNIPNGPPPGNPPTWHQQPPARPAGALPPRIPGYGSALQAPDDTSRPTPPSSGRESANSIFTGSSYFSDVAAPGPSMITIPPPPPLPAATLGVPPRSAAGMNSEKRVSNEDILATGTSGFARPISGSSAGSSQIVGRSQSTASTVSTSRKGLERNLTASTVATTSTTGTTYSAYDPTFESSTTMQRGDSFGSQSHHSDASMPYNFNKREPSITISDTSVTQGGSRLATELARTMAAIKSQEAMQDSYQDEYDEEEYEEYESDEGLDVFVNFALLSNIAVWLRDKVPRGTHVKGSIPYPRAFTGKDIVTTLQSQIRRELIINQGVATGDRTIALQVARSLQSQLFFYEVEWGGRILQDGVEDVYMFLDDQEGGVEAAPEREELPTSVITVLTKCYSPSCVEGAPCYSFACPRRPMKDIVEEEAPIPENLGIIGDGDWDADPDLLKSLPESEINRQRIIHKLISKEAQYIRDLDLIETIFIKPLRYADPPVLPYAELDGFIDDVFGNLFEIREANRRLLEIMNVRQREQSVVIQRIGDILLEAATEFRLVYPTYIGHLPLAEKRLKDETENNSEFRLFLEQCGRHPDARRMELKVFLNRPSEHVQKYENILEAIRKETAEENPDVDYLAEAGQAFKSLQVVCHLQTFQHAMGKGPTGKYEWFNLVSDEVRKDIPKQEQKRQAIIFELIKGEMQYVKDLENIDLIYVQPLREAEPPIISRDRLSTFISEVFHNFAELHVHHNKLLDRMHAIQREEHPVINSVTAAIFDAALNWREAYMEYVTNYPIAEYRIVDEMNNNPQFKAFVEQCTRHPDSNRLDMKSFVNRPIPRLARYELLLKGIMESSPEDHEDRGSIPQVIEVIKSLLKETQPGVASANQKVELWRYNANLVFKPGEAVDMDLLAENRSLIYTGKLLRQPDNGFEWSGWSELFVLLFDNYFVMTKPKEKDGITKYHVNRRPVPLDLLTLASFTDAPTQRGNGILRGLRGGERGTPNESPGPIPTASTTPDTPGDSRLVYPCTIFYNGRLGGPWTLYADSAQARAEWKEKMEEAIGLRKVIQESNKVFEVETLSTDTFLVPSALANPSSSTWHSENAFTGKVTCSVPFTTPDGRALVAVGCTEGVWIGFRHDARSMRRVLHVKLVTQCAMLEDFGIFLVLADKSLFAYHIEALVPSSPQSAGTSQTPQKLNGNRDVHFFSVGTLNGRTLVIYMKKKNLDSVFRVLEPVVGKIQEKAKAPVSLGSRFGFRQARSEWFRVYRDFFLPSESYDLIFLKARIAILCTKGFEIMDLSDFKSVTIPQRDDPRHEKLAKRCESCRPMGMFRSSENEFLLCYDEFGLYVNRHGDPSRTKNTIEWEGTAERVAWHPPYVLLFDTRFIEVRHVETGRLCQIIMGNDLRCIWDGRGTSAPPPLPGPGGMWEEGTSQEARVHGVMRATEPSMSGRAVAQAVFELIPTIPLYVPEKLSSPMQQTVFPHNTAGGSPPHSGF
ncbi:hypothetical protein EW146_g3989 [Bondarzewia mesenterica]|uniref:Uncharacterized protein n=1 Tax=Bondarzewia mesenterica TaxID=1095465 RepID=A0A4V3XF95_9AGAM|nr:hypothetical protein EW146_g3989 [Bondarzewia mesenterica]